MRKDFTPYYISRALLSILFSILVIGFNWTTIVFAIILFGLYTLYLHSGWFRIDMNYPLFPLRRDTRGQAIQRKALIVSMIVGLLLYLFSSQLSGILSLSISGNMALFFGIAAYFVIQFILLVRA